MNKDFKELIQCLNARQVRCLIVGGYALIEYTQPRFTKDLDIWIEPTMDNAIKLIAALDEFGAPLFGAKAEDFVTPGNVLQIGIEPIRVDILTSIDGVTFDQAWKNRVAIEFDGAPAHIISDEDLMKNKLATKRPSDRDDAELLRKAIESRKS